MITPFWFLIELAEAAPRNRYSGTYGCKVTVKVRELFQIVDCSGCVGRGDTHISNRETVHHHVVGLALEGESAACPAISYAGSHRAAAQPDYCIGGVRRAGHAHEEPQRGNRR